MTLLLETDSRELRKQRVIDPDAVYSKLWDVLVLIILLFNAAMIPYRIAFLPPTRGLFDAHYAVGFTCDGFLWFDVIIALHRGFHLQDLCLFSRPIRLYVRSGSSFLESP